MKHKETVLAPPVPYPDNKSESDWVSLHIKRAGGIISWQDYNEQKRMLSARMATITRWRVPLWFIRVGLWFASAVMGFLFMQWVAAHFFGLELPLIQVIAGAVGIRVLVQSSKMKDQYSQHQADMLKESFNKKYPHWWDKEKVKWEKTWVLLMAFPALYFILLFLEWLL